MQFVTSSGNFDIDDFILNILGASIMYGILKIRSINNFIRNIFLLEHNEISKKSYIRIFSTLAIVLLAIVLLVSIRKNIYNKNPVKKSLKFEVKICPKGKSLSVLVPNSLELKYFCIKIAMKKKFQKDKIPPKKIQRKNVLFAIVHRAARKSSPNRSMSKKIIL